MLCIYTHLYTYEHPYTYITLFCLFDVAGNWMVDVGIPAKSGVSGSIFGVIPGICGISVYSPRLNSSFNSVRGIEACTLISQRLGLHVLQKSKSKVSFWEAVTGGLYAILI